ncbi:MAG: hypothetical protein ACRDAG_01050 [Cetobacterium somerae]|uniref:hypothetical protein n=1 Tax=Cetobacterium somerae TaxID=188913 RepID=UPI003F2F38A2
MAKFNLKKILMQDYEVDLVQATNFERWVGKNMDYEAVMEKDFKNISFKSSKTNKKDFLKDLKERAIKLNPVKSVEDILELFDEQNNKNTIALYDKIRKLELELKETKERNDLQCRRLKEASNLKDRVYALSEVQEKIISEYNSYLRNFDLGFDISEYEKAIGKITYKRHTTLKEILVKNGIDSNKVDEILLEWKDKQHNNFEGELNSNINFSNYEEKRETLREQFKFINENQEFISTIIKLKGIDVKICKDIDKNKSSEHVISTANHLVKAGSVFVSDIINGVEHKTGWINAGRKIFNTNDKASIFEKIGVWHKVTEKQGKGNVVIVKDSMETIIDKFNKKVLEILKNNKEEK